MDGLSGAASVIAVGSLGIQLAETVKKLYDFWNSVHDAPRDIREITKELRILLELLKEMENVELTSSIEMRQFIHNAAESCLEKVEALLEFVRRFESQDDHKRKRRTWNSIKMVMQKDKIENFSESIEAVKSTLLIGLQLMRYRIPMDYKGHS